MSDQGARGKKIDLSQALGRLGISSEKIDALSRMDYDDPFWAEVVQGIAERSDGAEQDDTPRALLIGSVMSFSKGQTTLAIQKVARAAVMLTQSPDPSVSWGIFRDLVLNPVAIGADGAPVPHPAIVAAIGMAVEESMKGKARKMLAHFTEADPNFVQRTWEDMLAKVSAQPPGDYLPQLKALVQIAEAPPDLSSDQVEALTRELSKLPAAQSAALMAGLAAVPGWRDHKTKQGNGKAQQVAADSGPLLRPIVTRTSRDVFVSEAGPANVTMIIFCVTGTTPGAPLETFDRVLAERGIRAIYLCDLNDLGFINGVKGLGGSRDAMFAHLRTMIGLRPNDKIITLGASRAAMMAVISGLVLNVNGVITLAGVTSVDPAFRKKIGDDRNPELANKAFQLAGPDVDLHTWFARYSNRPIIHMYFSTHKKIDQAQAEGIAEYENVKLYPLEDHREHTLTSEMLEKGTFGRTIDEMLAVL